MTLRGAGDWPLWRAARMAALADSPDAFPGAAGAWADGGEDLWRERLLDPSALKVVAVLDEQPVGLVRAVVDREAVWLHSLWVDPRMRGHRLGDQLVAAVEEWGRPRAGVVRLEVVATNEAAIRFYRRHGYVEAPAAAEGGELTMQKLLT